MRFGSDVLPAIRLPSDELRRASPEVPAVRFRTQRQQIDSGFATEWLLARAAVSFSTVALLLACIGLFGLISYGVGRRTREIAVRMALGARQDGVILLVLREVVLLVVFGMALGLAATAALTRVIRGLLYNLTPTDPLTIAAAAILLAAVAVLAGYLPARRAARVQPSLVLRHE